MGPVLALIISGLLRLNYPLVGLYNSLTTMWFSSVKPLATILTVEKYRKHAFVWLFHCGKVNESKIGEATSTSAVTTKQTTRTVVVAKSN